MKNAPRRLPFIVLAVCWLLLLPSAAQAQYLDPGAGSMIVQVVIAVAVGMAATVKLYWRRVTALLGRRPKSDLES